MESRRILISGGARGLGAGLVRRALEDGHTVSVGARDVERARAALGDNGSLHIGAYDADDPAATPAWLDAARREIGPPDAVIANAGILRMVGLEDGDEADLDAMWRTNVMAPLRLIRAALPDLKASGRGRVIAIASTDAKRFRAGASLGYGMTKGALLAMTQAVRFSGWDEGLRGTAICPGAIDTEMIADMVGATPKAQRLRPDDVAEIVSMVLRLPNQASLPEIIVNTRLEASI
ncbi:MAG: SDR family NAD(P)-dependent oxidoreductase [Pseudomonadota bacterium]